MAKTYKAFYDKRESDLYRNLVIGRTPDTELDQPTGLGGARPTAQQQRPEEEQSMFDRWAGPILQRMGLYTDSPEQVANAVVPQTPTLPRANIGGPVEIRRWEDLPPLPSSPRLEQPAMDLTQARFDRTVPQPAREPQPDALDRASMEGSTRGPVPVSQQQGEDFDLVSSIEERLVDLEGFEDTAYKPVESEEYYTIGYGHYGRNVRQGQTITEAEARELLKQDIQERLPQIRRAFPEYDNFSPELQVELAQGWFRGDVSGSPETRRLINEGKFEEAATEFLNNDEYRRAEELGKPGIRPRMEAISAALRAEARR